MALIDVDGAAEFLCLPCLDAARLTMGVRGNPALARRLRRKAGANGALPASVYAEVRASGPCVYCGAPAEAADHVRALARGGLDVRENLVPACKRCNRSKKDRLLTEWDHARVEAAASLSTIVANELLRLRGHGG